MFDNLDNSIQKDFPELGIYKGAGITSLYYSETEQYQDMLSEIVNGDMLISEEDLIYICKVVQKIQDDNEKIILYLDSSPTGIHGSKLHFNYLKIFLQQFNIPYVESLNLIPEDSAAIVLNIISTPEHHKKFVSTSPERNYIFISFILELPVGTDGVSVKLIEVANNKTRDWEKIKDLPYNWLYNYTPKSYTSKTRVIEGERKLLWQFKDGFKEGCDSSKVNIISSGVGDIIYNVFGKDDISSIVLMPIPTGIAVPHKGAMRTRGFFDTQRYYDRFGILTSQICEQAGLINGMDYVRDKDGFHLFDNDFLKGKNVILFDDIITRGTTALQVSNELEELGANVLFLVCISKTTRCEM